MIASDIKTNLKITFFKALFKICISRKNIWGNKNPETENLASKLRIISGILITVKFKSLKFCGSKKIFASN